MQALLVILILSVSPAEQMLTVHNRIAPQRTLDPCLCRAAQDYADYLARTKQQGHFCDGDPEQRAIRSGFTGSLRTPGRLRADGWTEFGLGEVLAFGPHDSATAFDAWMQSPGHRAALLEPTYNRVGFGRNGTIWIAMFGRESKP